MKKVIIFIGRFVRLAFCLVLLVTFLIQGTMFLGEIYDGLVLCVKNGEIWHLIFLCELFLVVSAGLLFAMILCLIFIFSSIFAQCGVMPRDVWKGLFWTLGFSKS